MSAQLTDRRAHSTPPLRRAARSRRRANLQRRWCPPRPESTPALRQRRRPARARRFEAPLNGAAASMPKRRRLTPAARSRTPRMPPRLAGRVPPRPSHAGLGGVRWAVGRSSFRSAATSGLTDDPGAEHLAELDERGPSSVSASRSRSPSLIGSLRSVRSAGEVGQARLTGRDAIWATPERRRALRISSARARCGAGSGWTVGRGRRAA